MWLLGFYSNRSKELLSVEEFKEIFKEYYSDLCLYALKYVADPNTSKDIVQDVLIRFWEENDKLLNKNLVKSYLFKSVKNRSLNYLKREKRNTGLDQFLFDSVVELESSENDNAVSTITVSNLRKELERAIEDMPEQRRKIFRMSRFENLKHKEIAEELNISPKTVETQIYRSLNFLRKELKHYLD